MLTNHAFVVKYIRYANAMRKPEFWQRPSERGDGVSPLRAPLFSHFQAARDDRDGLLPLQSN